MHEAKGGSSPFRVRDFRLVFSGLAISSAGDWLYSIALVVYVFERTGSATWVGIASIVRLGPYIVFGPLGGVVADRYERRRVLIASDLARAGAMFAIALITLADGPVALVLVFVFLSTTAGTPDGPAIGSIVPLICTEEQLPKANALIGMVENVALVVGPALGGLLLMVGSTPAAFAVNGLTFLAAAATAVMLRTKTEPRSGGGPDGDATALAQLREGVSVVFGSLGILVMMGFIALAGLFYGHELTLIVLIAEDKLGLGPEGVGWLNTAVGVGGIAAAGLASRMASNPRSDLMLMAAVVGGAVPYALLSTTDVVAIGLLAMASIGAAAIALDVVSTTLLQRTLPNEIHARVLSLVDVVAVLAILIGSLIAPLEVDLLGLDGTLLMLGTVPLLALLTAPKLATLNRRAEETKHALAPKVGLIAHSSLFAGISRQSLEAIASVATHEEVVAGEAVVTEGQPADDIFIVDSGQLEVISSGESGVAQKVNELGPGDHFGEVGVLAAIPRTATVIATGEVRLLRVPGRVLLDVVNQEPSTSASIIDGMIGRLARTHPGLATTKAKEEIDAG